MEPSAHLHGAWRLTAYDDRESVGDEWGETYGADPVGLAIYDKTGCLSMQRCEADGSRFDAYFGRFAISGVSGGERRRRHWGRSPRSRRQFASV